MYAYPLCTIINEHNLHYHSYADDTQIYMRCDNNENAITNVIMRIEENCRSIKDISSCTIPYRSMKTRLNLSSSAQHSIN